jgi:hypothetical protein
MVVDKLGDMLKSSQDSQSLKLNLLNVLSNLDRDESSSMDQLHALETPERRMLDQVVIFYWVYP